MPDYAIRRLVQIEPYLTEAWFSEMNVRLTHTILRLRSQVKEGCISIGTTFTSGEGHIPRGMIYLLDWLPKGYGPSMEDRRICVVFDEKFGDEDREEGTPRLVLAIKATIEKHLRENPSDIFGPIIYQESK